MFMFITFIWILLIGTLHASNITLPLYLMTLDGWRLVNYAALSPEFCKGEMTIT